MPIVSRQFENVLKRRSTILADWLAVDDQGREFRRSYSRFADEAAAQAALDAFDWTPQLKDHEEDRAVAFIEAGGDPGDFTRSELTLAQFSHRIAKRLAGMTLEGNRAFICGVGGSGGVSSWAASKTVAQIEATLSISTARATTIRNRAIRLRDDICPALILDDADVDEGID